MHASPSCGTHFDGSAGGMPREARANELLSLDSFGSSLLLLRVHSAGTQTTSPMMIMNKKTTTTTTSISLRLQLLFCLVAASRRLRLLLLSMLDSSSTRVGILSNTCFPSLNRVRVAEPLMIVIGKETDENSVRVYYLIFYFFFFFFFSRAPLALSPSLPISSLFSPFLFPSSNALF